MKVDIKSKDELARMREACRMSAEVRDLCARAVMPGMRTRELDEIVKQPTELSQPGAAWETIRDSPFTGL